MLGRQKRRENGGEADFTHLQALMAVLSECGKEKIAVPGWMTQNVLT